MSYSFVFTLTGTDRVGIVEEVTERLLKLGGNIETSRMSRLGGEFAMLMLVALPAAPGAALEQTTAALAAQGFKVTTTPTAQTYAQAHAGWTAYQIQVNGADHEGIIHEIAHVLSQSGISIEAMDTGTTRAPNSGTPLFTMQALVVAPPQLAAAQWQEALEAAGHRLHVDVSVAPAPKA